MQRILLMLLLAPLWPANAQTPGMTNQEKAIQDRMGLRKLPESDRTRVTKALALEIRELPASVNKLNLASSLANLATEGDFGRDTLQEVTTTLSAAVRENPVTGQDGHIAAPYIQLARLVRYEGMQAKVDSPQFARAMTQLGEEDRLRESIDFSLTDLNGRTWKLGDLRGTVVLVNFWATWRPPCRKEMPDLQELYSRFKEKGLVILAITDEAIDTAKLFIEEKQYTFPVLLDSGRKVNDAFRVDGIPKTFIYDRDGKLRPQSIDMRTREQFTGMLAKAGLR